MSTLKSLLSQSSMPAISLKMLQDLARFTAKYEVRDNNSLALNTPMLGVNRCYWFQRDTDDVFAIFGIDQKLFISAIKQCPAIDKNFNVTSNEFNILVIWLIYLIKQNKSLSKQAGYNACIDLLKLLHYKFFCGKITQMFQYGAKESVMSYTIDNLTGKSDIKNDETDTWKKLIYKHCTVTLEPNSIYTNVFAKFEPDLAIAKAISDIHTRICRKIVLIAECYYENNKKGLSYTSSSIVMEDPEEGKKLADMQGTLDIACNRICGSVLNMNEFIDMNLVSLVTRLVSNIRRDNVISILTLFSNMATDQVRSKQTLEIKYDKFKQPLYVGYIKLINEMIQKTYRRIMLMGIDVKSNVAVLQATKNTYSASRVNDNDIMIVKDSVDLFLQQSQFTRQATLVSLRIALIMYLMMLSFKHMG